MSFVWSLIPKWAFHFVCWLWYYIMWTCIKFHICKHIIMETVIAFRRNTSKVQIHLYVTSYQTCVWCICDAYGYWRLQLNEQSCAFVCKHPVTHGKDRPYYTGISIRPVIYCLFHFWNLKQISPMKVWCITSDILKNKLCNAG